MEGGDTGSPVRHQTITNLAASPGQVDNANATETASTNMLSPGQTYSVRLKLKVGGSYNYGTALSFNLPKLPTPLITDSADQLFSSYAGGNQWYLDGTAIPGANGSHFVPQQSGSYTVESAQGTCITSMSQPVKLVVGNLVAGNLGVVSYPNPIRDNLTLINTQGRLLLVSATLSPLF